MKFTDEDVKRLKRDCESQKASVPWTIPMLEALLSRLEAAENLNREIGAIQAFTASWTWNKKPTKSQFKTLLLWRADVAIKQAVWQRASGK